MLVVKWDVDEYVCACESDKLCLTQLKHNQFQRRFGQTSHFGF